ncbi:hypothetical protein FGIG_06153 [Fasciola gigantica]|uniref:Reverse transcriptase domain-containing protein n=1 Tax=Fasciola gigantica TaxID=46835 RepID=A0A504Z781_FASGI|nr:hypothetical protein FGIG_06153 [Fasciola gigantica]
MDEVLSNSVPALGVTISGAPIDHLAYADDLVLFADNADRLRERLGALYTSLAAAGMCIDGAKSIGLTMRKDGKNKRMILWPTAYEVNGVRVQPLGVDQQVKYLGLQFTWKGRVQPRSAGKLELMLLNITKAPLKPHQCLDILARFALPKFKNELVLGMAHR